MKRALRYAALAGDFAFGLGVHAVAFLALCAVWGWTG